MTVSEGASVSSTGAPVLPPKIAAILAIVVGIAAVLLNVGGLPAALYTILQVIVSLGTVVGIVSPGVRSGALPGQNKPQLVAVDAPKPSV